MGRKLNKDEFADSVGSLQRYYFKHDQDNGPYTTRVEVIDNDTDEIEVLEISVVVYYDSTSYRINIIWEDAGYTREEFREKGLFGYYDCTWVPMGFNHNTLEIHSIDSNKTIYVS